MNFIKVIPVFFASMLIGLVPAYGYISDSPLSQLERGIPLEGILCDGDKALLQNDNRPACVSQGTAEILEMRGWEKIAGIACSNSIGVDIPVACDEINISRILAGAHNFREFTPNTSGDLQLREGQIFRSDALHEITDKDVMYLEDTIKVKTIIDLRSHEEIEEDPNKEISGAKTINYAIGTDPAKIEELGITEEIVADIRESFLDGKFERVSEILEENNIDIEQIRKDRYSEFVTDFDDSIKGTLEVLADESNYPIVFHCQGGKDRTGYMSAVIQKIIGYDDESIQRDYLTTNIYTYTSLEKQYSFGIESINPIYGAHERQLQTSLDQIIQSHGSFENYMEHLGITDQDLENIRKNLLA